MNIKTEETKEIIDVSNVLIAFLRHGIYRFRFEDVTGALPFGMLSNLKLETFSRWMRNPLYQYTPSMKSWQFIYGRRVTFFTKDKKNVFGLEDAIIQMGYENFVRWLRIWSANFAHGAKSAPDATQSLENRITAIYNTGVKIAQEKGIQAANKATLPELKTVWKTACELKGRPDYLTEPVGFGRKTTVYISRTARSANKATFRAEPFVFEGAQDLIITEE